MSTGPTLTLPSAALIPAPGQQRLARYRSAAATDVRATWRAAERRMRAQAPGAGADPQPPAEADSDTGPAQLWRPAA